jgi:indolepyruvate ferredoxin oxidoreductase alpha subunit
MTRFVVDAGAALAIAAGSVEVRPEHELFAPTLLRSQALSTLHEAVVAGDVSASEARERLRRLNGLPIRLLGDAVLRRRAWELADQLGWAETYDAEYVALTQLQAEALVTTNAALARRLEGVVQVAALEALATP